jgi:hypothetical protein
VHPSVVHQSSPNQLVVLQRGILLSTIYCCCKIPLTQQWTFLLFDQVDVLTMNLLLLDYEMCRGQKNNEKHGKEQLDMQRKKGIFCKIMIPDHVIFE